MIPDFPGLGGHRALPRLFSLGDVTVLSVNEGGEEVGVMEKK